jgi:WD40 repeat protein
MRLLLTRLGLVCVGLLLGIAPVAAEVPASLGPKAEAVLKAHCYRCHGQQGSVEGGMNYILDRDKLIARRKIVPGHPEQSPLYRRLAAGKMPPPGEQPRPSTADRALLKQWIEAGAPAARPHTETHALAETAVYDLILADLDKLEKRSRRFTRYFSLVPLANAGLGPDELQTYRNALGKLINSLSWHPRITLPKPVDAAGLLLRIDLRDYQWDATLWNRLLAEYPYGILHDTAVARAVLVATRTRMPCVRLDWFVANASRPPLYYDLLQMPTNSSELERQLRVDVALDVQQERVARAGFNGSGISRNNRILERHDAQNGAYWRTYDFNAIPQNLIERDLLLPDRRNLFAYPLGPGLSENTFQHAGGEIIFNLPNGLQGYLLVNADNQRLNKGPNAIVSDPKRPDRAVEAGISCMHCHARGLNFKDDQIRDHVGRNPKAFSRADAELIRALYIPKEKMRKLMEEDCERFRKAVEKTGNKVAGAEPVIAMTLRYEADVDLPTLAAELGLSPRDVLAGLAGSEKGAKNLGALKVPGATVARQVVVQSFGDLVRDFRLGTPFQAGVTGESLPDNTGEVDPLESQSNPANAIAFGPDGKVAAFASADKTVRLWDVQAGRELRRCIGHTASVWCVAFSPDGSRVLSGGKDGSVRLWDVATGRELLRLDGHADLVTSVAFTPDGHRALSAGFDHEVFLWDLDKGTAVPGFTFRDRAKYINHLAVAANGKQALVCAERTIYLIDAHTGKEQRRLVGHTGWVNQAVFERPTGETPVPPRILSGADDGTVRLWDPATGKELKVFRGHGQRSPAAVGVKSVAFRGDGRQVLSGGSDATVRLWDVATGKEVKVFRKHADSVVGVVFLDGGRATLSGSRDADVRLWRLGGGNASTPTVHGGSPYLPRVQEPPAATVEELRPVAVVRVGGTVGRLHLSPNRRWLYYLNRTTGTVERVDGKETRRTNVLRLAEGTDALCLTPDGKTLVATASIKPARPGAGPNCLVQVIDAGKLTLRRSFKVAVDAYDVAANDAGLVFISGGGSEWSEIAVVDVNKQAVVGRWGGVWNRSLLGLAPDQGRLYYSSQGVIPGTLEGLVIPRKPADRPTTYRASVPARYPLGGAIQISPDGRFLLCKTGTVLRLSAENDLQFQASLPPFLSAAVDADGQAVLLLTRDGLLRRYSYPDFRPQGAQRLGLAAYGLAWDGKGGRLYVAGFDPKEVAENPRARGHGDIHVYVTKGASGVTRLQEKRGN